MSFLQQRPSYARSSHAPAQRDAMRAMLVAAAFDDPFQGAKSPDSAEWSSGSGDGTCDEDVSDKLVVPGLPGCRKRTAASLAEPSERRTKYAKSSCGPEVRTRKPSIFLCLAELAMFFWLFAMCVSS
jgi:hypothetical protein